jgi:glycosyltransferase involved in cell wall biosynthesis
MDPKISIVTPSYNQGQFIEEAICSVLAQKYDNFEHIVIDGGSSDNTIEVLKRYPHLIWISETDEGQSDAINKGFRLAQGEIIGWLNSDDYYLPGTFLKVVNNLYDCTIDAVYSNYCFTDANGTVFREIITQKSSKWMSLFYCFIPSTTFFFRKEILQRDIYIDKQFHIAMDKEFFAHIYYSGFYIQKVDAFFAHFRWHETNKSIDTKEIKAIRIREGLHTFNRYSGFVLPINILGITIYKFLMLLVGLFRTLMKIVKVGLYAKR